MIQPCLLLADGKCQEALDFYERVFNGKNKTVLYFKDIQPSNIWPLTDKNKDLIFHAEMDIAGTRFNFGDIERDMSPGNMLSLIVLFDKIEEVIETFDKLREGGQVLLELSPQFYSPMCGWIIDQFGVTWQIMCRA